MNYFLVEQNTGEIVTKGTEPSIKPGGGPWSAHNYIVVESEIDTDIAMYEMNVDSGEVDGEGNPILINRIAVDTDKVVAACAAAKLAKKQEVRRGMDTAANEAALKHYPTTEPLGWAAKEEEAFFWLALDNAGKDAEITNFNSSPSADSEYLLILSEAGVSTGTAAEKRAKVDTLVTRITTNAKTFKRLQGTLAGKKTAMQEAVDALPDTVEGLAQIKSYTVTYA